jgi:stage II sporulation protein D
MKYLSCVVFIIFLCFVSKSLRGEDSIRVLILESPGADLPAKSADKIGKINGDILISDILYSGSIEVSKDEKGLHFINSIPFEKYIEGVIAAETGEDWAMEALKAQAVISRTYAMYRKNRSTSKDYHITSSTLHQVYRGKNTNEVISKAVRETLGEHLTFKGEPIEAFYHSTCIGNTELPHVVWGKDYPYIKSVPCRGEHSPYEKWQRRFRITEIEEALGMNGIEEMYISGFTSTGRADLIKVITASSNSEIKAVDLRKLLGYRDLPSTHFSLIMEGGDVVFEGGGYGHGVGLSQWGALELAHEGKNYKEILEHYYPGTVLQQYKGEHYHTSISDQ